jgi:hypothetical protein
MPISNRVYKRKFAYNESKTSSSYNNRGVPSIVVICYRDSFIFSTKIIKEVKKYETTKCVSWADTRQHCVIYHTTLEENATEYR